ncbi:GNAT family N-acetyltransferase [uncultured Sphingomonas sp.]|uniref:GNAT family N-acetyltransferase n=1 Tax=uncultured Sphingomonas sp. TaxID=158754 RepID=UPI0025990778|nr:GNAT family N-acetyltransferase [uncultured Sphingomonas sp.]
MTVVPLRFQIGARTLASVSRRLDRIALSLEDVLALRVPALPDRAGDGYLVTSLPQALRERIEAKGRIVAERQCYTRYYTDLSIGHAAWLSSLSGQARSTLRRKSKKAVAAGLEIRAFRTAEQFDAFHPLARAISARTYQERLLDAGLPDDSRRVATLRAAAARDELRAWLLLIAGKPVAYLCCTAQGSALRYDHVGHDPAYGELSPGTVLHAAAMAALFEDRFRWFDFTEGEGQHKRLLATNGIACVDLLVLRPTLANWVVVVALMGFDGLVGRGKKLARRPVMTRMVRRLRR